MRPATDDTKSRLSKHGTGARGFVLFFIENQNSLRIFSSSDVPDDLIGQGGSRFFLDGTWLLDGSVTLGIDTLEESGIHPWILDAGSFEEGRSLTLDPFRAIVEHEIPRLQFTVSNKVDRDGYPQMSRILAQEPFINALVDVRFAFKGQNIFDLVLLAAFRVRRIVERMRDVSFDCEAVG